MMLSSESVGKIVLRQNVLVSFKIDFLTHTFCTDDSNSTFAFRVGDDEYATCYRKNRNSELE